MKNKPKPKRTVRYGAKVDPTFTQAQTNPLWVTYAYSADATLTDQNGTTDLAKSGQLPPGVLNFYSAQAPGGPKSLYCSMNVGGTVSGGSCPVNYSNTGDYEVTTQYIPNGVSAVSETDTETISPYTTTTTLTDSLGDCESGYPPGYPSAPGPYCEYTLSNTVVDQFGNDPASQVALTVGPDTGQAPEGSHMPADGSCTIYVTHSWVLSPDCNFELGSGLYDANSWSITASYVGRVGWSGSSSDGITVTPTSG